MSVDLSNLPTKGYSKKDVKEIDFINSGNKYSTGTLDAIDTEEIIRIGNPGTTISLQTSGTLTANATFSINGADFITATAISSGAIASYSAHVISYVKITRTAGAGKAFLVTS